MKALVLFLLLASVPVRAATLRGVTQANELGGPPVANVQVSAEGANPDVSNADGTFILEFPHKQAGDMVRLVVQKRGMVVVNHRELDLALPKDASRPLVVLLSTSEKKSEAARLYYGLDRAGSFERENKTRIEELETKYKSAEVAIQRLASDRSGAERESPAERDTRAERVQRTTPDRSHLYQDARSLVSEGDADGALAMLDDQNLQRAVALAKERQKEVVDAYLLKAELLSDRSELDRAVEACRNAIAFAPEEIEPHFVLADLQDRLNRLDEAESEYRRALDLARGAGDQPRIAAALRELGAIHRYQDRSPEARRELSEAIGIYRSMSAGNAFWQGSLVSSLNELGLLFLDREQTDAADRVFAEGLAISRKLSLPGLFRHRGALGLLLMNTARLRLRQDRQTEAEAAYREAAKIFDELPARANLAQAYQKLGELLGNQGRAPEALEVFGKAVDLFRALGKENPDAYRPAYASALNNRAMALRDIGRVDDARTTYGEALKIFRELAARRPDYLGDVAWTLDGVADVDWRNGRIEDAQSAVDEAISIFRRLAVQDRQRYLPGLAEALTTVCDVNRETGLFAQSQTADREALAIYRELAVKDPARYLPKAAWIVHHLGLAERDQGLFEAAGRAFEESLQLHRQLVEQDRERFLPILADVLIDVAELSISCENREEALALLLEAEAIYRDMAEAQQGRYFAAAAQVLMDTGEVLAKQQKIGAARATWEEALVLFAHPRLLSRSLYLRDVEETRKLLSTLPP